jgi:hypothetical protein
MHASVHSLIHSSGITPLYLNWKFALIIQYKPNWHPSPPPKLNHAAFWTSTGSRRCQRHDQAKRLGLVQPLPAPA